MATRRPKVPRATPAVPAVTGEGDGADVIQADFGRARATVPAASRAAAQVPDRGPQNSPGQAPGKVPAAAADPGGPAAGASGAGTPDPAGRADAPDGSPVPAKTFSGRLLALGMVMIAITILLAPTVKIFLDKSAEIAALEADIAARQGKQDELKRQVSRWQDPNFVQQQARDRINMVMPGETGYWVFGSDLPTGQAGDAEGAASAQDPARLPWVDSLWESVRRSATD